MHPADLWLLCHSMERFDVNGTCRSVWPFGGKHDEQQVGVSEAVMVWSSWYPQASEKAKSGFINIGGTQI